MVTLKKILFLIMILATAVFNLNFASYRGTVSPGYQSVRYYYPERTQTTYILKGIPYADDSYEGYPMYEDGYDGNDRPYRDYGYPYDYWDYETVQ